MKTSRTTFYTWDNDESIFKSKEAKEKPCGIDEASMEKDEGAEARRGEEKCAAMVFGEALKWGLANTQGRGLEETKKEKSNLSWFTKREESGVISIEFLYYIHEWKYKGPKLSIYSRKGEPSGLEKWRKKGSKMWYLEPKREHWGKCNLLPKQVTRDLLLGA